MTALIAIPVCAILYRARGAGWPRQWWGLDDRGVVKNLTLLIMAILMAWPFYVTGEIVWWYLLIPIALAFITGRAAHGEFFHMGRQTPKRERDDNAWIGWVTNWADGSEKNGTDGRSFVSDFFGNALTGFLFVMPFVVLAGLYQMYVLILIYTVAGFLGKPVAYLIGWYPLYNVKWVEFKQTGAGEWLTGLFLGIGVYVGWLHVIS